MNVLSLFSGIGGLDLGLERAGMTTVGQVEIDPYCQRVLAKHWPEVPRHDDVRTATAWWASQPRPKVDVVAGGFPCQPFSVAGHQLGVADKRWGWPWMADVIRVVRPRYVLVENVAALLDDTDAFGRILSDLAADGFDADWSVLSACAVDAPHARKRLFLLAHAHGLDGAARLASGHGWTAQSRHRGTAPWVDPVNGLLDANARSHRVAHGVPGELDKDRVTALGNAVVPQLGEYAGRLILAHHHETQRSDAA